ncbi:hypothetical protein CcI156_16170 [Frankia sp. CcI156]|uniref:Transcriptional regulator, TetR family n=1 Tax=Frankia casuarinae (strain DSM 45818 / CECT 9043 / HFP020203 / CcI3) TaxID=106370 RepID=Q2JAZ5_FRACC|nr:MULTISPECIES: TetR/AcrR family transcriptional regulator [Frankia]ABD11547.1 transcriptional regulator, TetR family [Frankia casuarinae]ETA01150.1 transcriptional regulator, TetR family [Frankia sp. CcI6]EYT91597.1 transcriptional regulator, TetR family [Frankia casuarinae]KDA41179.1 transcriptional regulator, TetR family [Frankia sp. BMG5.23]OAA22666.1 transcriptional regulator [Frankia casuarinae]
MRPRAVTREQIIAAADTIARRDGLDHLTVRPLCAELGVTAPAIYRRFPTKNLIVERVVDDALGRIDLPGPETGDWADRLGRCFTSAHDVAAAYPGLAAHMGRQMAGSPSAVRNASFLHDLLIDAGIGPEDANRIICTMFVYLWGHLLAAEAVADLLGSTGTRDQFLWGLDHLLGSFRRQFGGPVPGTGNTPEG